MTDLLLIANTMTKRTKDSEIVVPAGAADKGDGHLDADQLDLSSNDEEDSEEDAGALEVDSRDEESEPASAEDDEEDDLDELESSDDEVGRTVLDLIQGRDAGAGSRDDAEDTQDRQDRTADAESAHDPGSDSSEDERPSRNTGAAATTHPLQPRMHACATSAGLRSARPCTIRSIAATAAGGGFMLHAPGKVLT